MSSRRHHRGLSGRLFLIDGSSFCYRAFYAIRNLSTSRGQPTNAIYGVVTMLTKILEDERPEYVAVAFDVGKPTFRHLAYEKYKQHRPSMPDALVSQLSWIKEVLKAFRIPIFEKEGYEADDVLGTLARKAEQEGLDVFVVTSDKDLLQLVNEKIKVYRPGRDGHEIIDQESLRKRWNVTPAQVVDVMALMGDATDAIPGVPGIGEKTAVELIQRFDSVDHLLRSVEAEKKSPPLIKPSLAAAIRQNKEQIALSRSLASLDTQVPIDLKWDEVRRQEPDRAALADLFKAFEFRTLLKEYAPEQRKSALEVRTLESADQARSLAASARRSGAVAVAQAVDRTGKLVGIGLSEQEESAWAIPSGPRMEPLGQLWEDPQVRKICPALKEALVHFGRSGVTLRGPVGDPTLASYLLDPARPSHKMSALSQEFLGELIEDPDPLTVAALEAHAALQLVPRLEKEIKEKGLAVLYEEVEIPLSHVLARMERTGIAVDQEELRLLKKEMDQTLERLRREIYSQAGEEFNINSPKQMAGVLFGKLKLPVVKRTKTGPSTDEEVLRRLSAQHALPATLLDYREMFKLTSTYVEALPKLVDPATGRIHTSFNQTVTATGRLSSSNPNLQNIPIRTPWGRRIRTAFVPSDPARLFLAADYSQIELRILAHLSQDEALLAAFQSGGDIHRVTAAEVFHVSEERVSNDQRSAAKTINFGIVYGMTPFGLAKELGISPEEAQGFIERYFSKYPGVRRYLDRIVGETRERGYCTTILERRRYIPEIASSDITVRQFAERTATNAPIQGSAADLIKVAMLNVDRAIERQGLSSRMLLTVHDELIFEVPTQELDEMRRIVKETMECPRLSGRDVRLSVPIEVKLKTGHNWLEASHA